MNNKIKILDKEFEVGDMVELGVNEDTGIFSKNWSNAYLGYIKYFRKGKYDTEIWLRPDRKGICNDIVIGKKDITSIKKLVYER